MSEKKFNIFQVAGIWKSEEIHTSVIAELINPKSEFHDKGADFLDKFLQMEKIGVELTGEKPEDAVVEAEVPTSQGRRIDMVISTKNLYLPFEVKIWAGDQDAQLRHYYEFAKSQGKEVPAIYYLTPDGHEPSEQSRGYLGDAVRLLSFKADILPWLKECMDTLDIRIHSDVWEIMRQMYDNIQGGSDTQVRSGVQLRCFSKWEKTDVLDAIYQKLSLSYDIPWTECTPTYMTFTLNKMEFGTASLEFALRLKKERVKKEREGRAEYEDRVRLHLICGLTQEDGKPDYAAAGSYISKNPEDFEMLRANTFEKIGFEVKSGKATWDWLPEKVCFDDAGKCCCWIKKNFKGLLSQKSKSDTL